MAKKKADKTTPQPEVQPQPQPQPQQPAPSLLALAVQATQTGQPFFATMDAMGPLWQSPQGQLVEYNETMVRPDGTMPFRATALGMQVFQNGAAPQPQPQPAFPAAPPFPAAGGFPGAAPAQPATFAAPPAAPAPAPAAPGRFTFLKNIPVPAARRGGKGSNQYGFEAMEVGDAFDVVATADDPAPAKRIASTVSSASRRLEPKKFIVRSIEVNGVKCARVWRSQ